MPTDRISTRKRREDKERQGTLSLLRKAQRRADVALASPALRSFVPLVRKALGFPGERPDDMAAFNAWSQGMLEWVDRISNAGERWVDVVGDRASFDAIWPILSAIASEQREVDGTCSADLSPWDVLDRAVHYIVRTANLDDTWTDWARDLLENGNTNSVSVGGYTMPLPHTEAWHTKVPTIPITDDMTEADLLRTFRELRRAQKYFGRTRTTTAPIDDETKMLTGQMLELRAAGKGYRAIANSDAGQQYLARRGLQTADRDTQQRAILNLLYPILHPRRTSRKGGIARQSE